MFIICLSYVIYIYIYITYTHNSLLADSSDKGSDKTSKEKQHRVKCYPPDTLHGRFHREKYRCAEVRAS